MNIKDDNYYPLPGQADYPVSFTEHPAPAEQVQDSNSEAGNEDSE